MCFGTACNPDHKTCNSPIFKKLQFKFVKWMAADNAPRDAASWVATDATTPAPAPTPSSASVPSSDKQSGSALIPGAFSALDDQASYDSGDKFDYEGKAEGTMYVGNSKTNASYNYSHVSCRNVTVEPTSSTNSSATHKLGGVSTTASGKLTKGSTASCTATDPQGVNTIYLPKTVLALLNNPPSLSVVHYRGYQPNWMSLLVADTGATNHMLPNKAAFVLYYPVSGQQVRMGNNSFAPIHGHGTAVISLNGKKILIREWLHVPELQNLLYSLWAHQRQCGCRFIGMHSLGMHVFFPSFIMEVKTATDCHLYYKPIGRACRLADLDYVQPKYVTNRSASATATTPVPPQPTSSYNQTR